MQLLGSVLPKAFFVSHILCLPFDTSDFIYSMERAVRLLFRKANKLPYSKCWHYVNHLMLDGILLALIKYLYSYLI